MDKRNLNILLLEDNPGDARLVQEILSESDDYTFHIECVTTLVDALNRLAVTTAEFDVALVDLSLPDCQGFDTFRSIQQHAPGLPLVVLTGLANDVAAVQAVESGVQDYLVKGTLTAESLVRALQYAIARQHGSPRSSAPAEKAKVIGVVAAKGGVGATTVACLLAIELGHQSKNGALLMDLDTSTSSASFLLKSNFAPTILDPAMSLHRLDIAYWKGVVWKTPYGIDLLQSPGVARFAEQLPGERIRHVLRFARANYGHIVIDMSRLNSASLALFPELQEVLVVTTCEMHALYETKRVLPRILETGLRRDQVRLILNRVPKALVQTMNQVDFGVPIAGALSDHFDELQEALISDRPLEKAVRLRRQAGELVSGLFGGAPAEKVGGLSRFRLARVPG